MSIAVNISLVTILAIIAALAVIAVAIHFISKESILNRMEIAFRVLLGGAGLALGTLAALLFTQWDYGMGRAFLLMMMFVVPYLLYLAVKGYEMPNERNGIA